LLQIAPVGIIAGRSPPTVYAFLNPKFPSATWDFFCLEFGVFHVDSLARPVASPEHSHCCQVGFPSSWYIPPYATPAWPRKNKRLRRDNKFGIKLATVFVRNMLLYFAGVRVFL
jgi:hypothetical protein